VNKEYVACGTDRSI